MLGLQRKRNADLTFTMYHGSRFMAQGRFNAVLTPNVRLTKLANR